MLMAQTAGAWTLADLDRLPDDGNSYELIDGALFVTPAPSPAHETLVAVMHVILSPYVLSERLGLVYASRASVRTSNGHVEPDLLVRPTPERPPATWETAPTPLLIVEVLSDGAIMNRSASSTCALVFLSIGSSTAGLARSA